MKKPQKKQSKPYVSPEITKVKLEDRRVVAANNCKDSLENQSCGQDGVTPLFTIDPS